MKPKRGEDHELLIFKILFINDHDQSGKMQITTKVKVTGKIQIINPRERTLIIQFKFR